MKSHKRLPTRVGRSQRDLGIPVQEEAGGMQLGPISIPQVAVPWRDPLQEGIPRRTQAAVLMLLRVRGHDPEVCLKTCINIFFQREHSCSSAKQVC